MLSLHHSLSCWSTKLLVHPLILKVFACSLVWIYLCIRSCQMKVTKLLIISNMPQSRSSKTQDSGLARLLLSRMLLHAGRCLWTRSKVYSRCLIVPDLYSFSNTLNSFCSSLDHLYIVLSCNTIRQSVITLSEIACMHKIARSVPLSNYLCYLEHVK